MGHPAERAPSTWRTLPMRLAEPARPPANSRRPCIAPTPCDTPLPRSSLPAAAMARGRRCSVLGSRPSAAWGALALAVGLLCTIRVQAASREAGAGGDGGLCSQSAMEQLRLAADGGQLSNFKAAMRKLELEGGRDGWGAARMALIGCRRRRATARAHASRRSTPPPRRPRAAPPRRAKVGLARQGHPGARQRRRVCAWGEGAGGPQQAQAPSALPLPLPPRSPHPPSDPWLCPLSLTSPAP